MRPGRMEWTPSPPPGRTATHQIVVPTQLRPKLLYIAYDIYAASHLSLAKTKTRLQRHFYWPVISNNVIELCRTCEVCKRLGKGTSFSVAPFHLLFVV